MPRTHDRGLELLRRQDGSEEVVSRSGFPEVGASSSAEVKLGNRKWSLAPGETLTFGRARDRDIRFAHDPEDDYVSRRAGTLLGLSDGVLIRNESSTQSLVLQAFPGPEIVIAPLMGVATAPDSYLRLVVPGRHGARYALLIDTRRMREPDEPEPVSPVPVERVARPTRSGAARITGRELRMLAALCEPVLLYAGPEAVPATYKQIAARTGATQASVRTCLSTLRSRLSDRDGIPGLRFDDEDEAPQSAAFLPALAMWAVHSGAVTEAELAVLNSQ